MRGEGLSLNLINRQVRGTGMPKGHCDSEVLYIGRVFEEELATGVGPKGGKCSDFSIECLQVEGVMEEPRGGNPPY